jgi:hypothetical protein
MPSRKIHDGLGVDVPFWAGMSELLGLASLFVFDGLEAADVEVEDGEGLFNGERRVVERDVDAGLESFVEGADAVGGQEQDAGIVFEHAEEY